MASGKTFDPKKVKASFGAIILGDYAKGTFIKATQDGDDFTWEKGADGSYDRINNNNNMVTVEVMIRQTSPINDMLSAWRIADKAGNVGGVPLLIKDMGPGGTTMVVVNNACITKVSELTQADSLQSRTWTFQGVGVIHVGSNS